MGNSFLMSNFKRSLITFELFLEKLIFCIPMTTLLMDGKILKALTEKSATEGKNSLKLL